MTGFPPLPLAGPALPPFDRAALLLDLDGTLLDIAPTPDAVVVPPGLAMTLARLRDRLEQALAVVTGRPIAQVDSLLRDIPTAVAGEHGGAIRHGIGEPILRAPLPTPPALWLDQAERLVGACPGVLLERKQRGFVLHYRAAPALGATLHRSLVAMIESDPAFALQPALMAWEVRPHGVDKGTAVAALMAQGAFAGRLPIFIGDDTTDEDGMRVARTFGGVGLRVADAFGGAADVRAWLAAAARSA